MITSHFVSCKIEEYNKNLLDFTYSHIGCILWVEKLSPTNCDKDVKYFFNFIKLRY